MKFAHNFFTLVLIIELITDSESASDSASFYTRQIFLRIFLHLTHFLKNQPGTKLVPPIRKMIAPLNAATLITLVPRV